MNPKTKLPAKPSKPAAKTSPITAIKKNSTAKLRVVAKVAPAVSKPATKPRPAAKPAQTVSKAAAQPRKAAKPRTAVKPVQAVVKVAVMPRKVTLPTPLAVLAVLAPVVPSDKASKGEKPKKQKMVRDSFNMPENDYAHIAALKKRCLKAGTSAKKSEVLRAALKCLSALSDEALTKAIADLDAVKTGRPSKR